MVLLKATHIDVKNLIASASLDKPYLVYSIKKGNPNTKDSYNILEGRKVYIRWAGKEDKENVALVILDDKKTKDIIGMSIEARTNGGLTKFENRFYSNLQPIILKMNDVLCLQNDDVSVTKAPTKSSSKPSISNPKVPSTLATIPEEVNHDTVGKKEVDPDADVKKRFNEKYSYFADKKKALVSETYIDRDLDYKFKEHEGYALQLLTDDKARKSYSKLDLDLVTLTLEGYYTSKHYLVPKGCGYLVLGDLNKDYYEKFKVDEKQLDKDIENIFEVYGKLDKLISKINKEQKFEDTKNDILETIQGHKEDFVETSKDLKDDLINTIKDTKFGKFLNKLSK